jgi:hypothetical protein
LGGTSPPVFWRFVLYVVLTEVIQVCAIKKRKKGQTDTLMAAKYDIFRHIRHSSNRGYHKEGSSRQQQQRVSQRGQLQTIIRLPAVFPRWLAKYHSKDTATNIAALHVCIFIQKCWKMIEKTV